MNKGKVKTVGALQIFLNKKLGEGTFGIVYEGLNTQKNQHVAIKCLNKNLITKDQYMLNALKNQIKILLRIKSPHVVSFNAIQTTARNFYIAQELCDGDLSSYMKKQGKLTEDKAIQIFSHILKGFYELILLGVVHRDLKPENILYKGQTFKICDFGLAIRKSKNSLLKTTVGTETYQSPQQILGQNYSYKCDIWALGCIFYELLFFKKFIRDREDLYIIAKQFELKLPKYPQISEESKQILENCLKFSQEDRADWQYLFEHPIFKNQLPSIKNLKQKLNYIMTKIRNQVQQQNIDLEIFFDKFKKNQSIPQLNLNQFSKLLLCLVPDLQISEIKYIFWNFDENGNGTVCVQEFEHAIKAHSLYKSVKPKDIFRADGSKMPTEEEKVYQKFIQAAVQQKINTLHDKFVEIDQNSEGLDKKLFAELCLTLCSDFNQHQINLLFEKFDENKDQKVSYGEFYKYVCKVVGMTPRSIIRDA